MNENKSLSDFLVDGYKKGEFDRKLLAEKELLKSRSYDELLDMTAAMSVYINKAMPILLSNIPLMTQAYLNGIEKARSDVSQKMSNAGRKGHVETYELKAQAIEYWRAHIDPKLSNPKAADLLIRVVALSHRKLVEYVAEAKRQNIHSAS